MFLWRTGENYPRIISKYSSLSSPLDLIQILEVNLGVEMSQYLG